MKLLENYGKILLANIKIILNKKNLKINIILFAFVGQNYIVKIMILELFYIY